MSGRVVSGNVWGNVRGMSGYRPGMAHRKSGHPRHQEYQWRILGLLIVFMSPNYQGFGALWISEI